MVGWFPQPHDVSFSGRVLGASAALVELCSDSLERLQQLLRWPAEWSEAKATAKTAAGVVAAGSNGTLAGGLALVVSAASDVVAAVGMSARAFLLWLSGEECDVADGAAKHVTCDPVRSKFQELKPLGWLGCGRFGQVGLVEHESGKYALKLVSKKLVAQEQAERS